MVQITLVGGLVLLMFAGFSAFHHVRLHLEDDDVALPLEIIATTLAGLVLVLFGALSGVTEFKPTKGVRTLNAIKRDEFLDRPSFRRYNHLARELRIRASKLA